MAENTENFGWVLEDQEALGPIEAREVHVRLNDQEVIEHADDLAAAMGELGEMEKEKKAWLDQWKADVSKLERRIAHNRVAITKRQELRTKELQWIFNFHEKRAMLLDPDDPENPVEERAMTTDELQRVLDFPKEGEETASSEEEKSEAEEAAEPEAVEEGA